MDRRAPSFDRVMLAGIDDARMRLRYGLRD